MVTESAWNKSTLFDDLSDRDVAEIDPCYKLFLQHLRKDGRSYVLDVPNGDHGMPTFVRYEVGGMLSGEADSGTVMNLSNSSLRRSQDHTTKRRTSLSSCTGPNVNAGLRKKSSAKRSALIDESYEAFLSLLKFKDGSMVVEIEPGVSIIYEQESDEYAASETMRNKNVLDEQEIVMTPSENMETEQFICTDEEVPAHAANVTSEYEMDKPALQSLDNEDGSYTDEQALVLYKHPSDLTACEDDQGSMLALSFYTPSTFEDKLAAVLGQPYDQNEYEELMKKATDRKPVSRQRHLRNASKRYATDAVGLSYLDYYPDLAIQIDTADCHERLNLLRQFFFWLENLCHEGAYMPWIPKPIACDPIATEEYEPRLALEMSKDED